MGLVWPDRARNDLYEIARYSSRSNPGNARGFVSRLQTRAHAAAKAPRAGRHVPEFDPDGLRAVIEGNCRIVYRRSGRRVEVARVIEGRRILGSAAEKPERAQFPA
jgi:plasmid stabilization system protein ParE